MGYRYAGTHLIIDLFGAKRLDDLKHIKETLKRCVEVAGATLLHIHLHHFTPTTAASQEWRCWRKAISASIAGPRQAMRALDVFMCGDAKPHADGRRAKQAFKPTKAVVKEHLRADTAAARTLKAVPRNAPARERAQAAA